MEIEKFWTKTKLIVLAVILLIIVIVIGAILLYRSSMKKKYMLLESSITNVAPNYMRKEIIKLSKVNEYRKINIDLLKKDQWISNSNMDDCEGYVIARKTKDDDTYETYAYKTYLKCKNIYITEGYGSTVTGEENQTVTQTENDTKAPVITLKGADPMDTILGEEFKDPGATAMDNIDKDVTKKIKVEGTVDVNKVGEYVITYSVSDKAGNKATKDRKVIVKEGEKEEKDTNPPVITFINPESYQKICIGQKVDISATGLYGYTAYDDKDGNITNTVVITGDVGTQNKAGTYTINYSSTDSSKNTSTATRTYSVVDCTPTPTPTPTPQPQPSGGGNSGGGNSGGNGGSPSSSSSSSSEVVRPEVNITVNVTGINAPSTLVVGLGGKASLNASVLPSNATNKTLTYRSNNAGIASVDGNGVVTGVSKGETRVIITSNNGIQKAVNITVR